MLIAATTPDLKAHVSQVSNLAKFILINLTFFSNDKYLFIIYTDADLGNNSVVTYQLKSTPDTHSQWFQIDTNTGLITTREHIDCETDPIPRLIIVANDHGSPSLSSSATIHVRIMNVKVLL